MTAMIPISSEPDVPPKLPPHVRVVRNPTGRLYYYLHKHRGTDRERKPIRLPEDPRSPEFWTAYARHMQIKVESGTKTVAALDAAWAKSPEWDAIGDKTKTEWTRYRGRITAAWGHLEVAGIEPKHVLALRDEYAGTPAAANNLMRCLSSMLRWSVPRGWRRDNPCRDIDLLAGGEGYLPWPMEVIEDAKANLRPDLWWAAALALYTGQRKGDCLTMRWDHLTKDSRIAVKQAKTGKRLVIPLHRELRAVLDGIPKRAVTILTNTAGRPWKSGFNASWQASAWQPPEPLVFHGLRKSAVVMLLEAGATTAEVAAVTGQSLAMVEHYAKQVNQERLARTAILRWEQRTK